MRNSESMAIFHVVPWATERVETEGQATVKGGSRGDEQEILAAEHTLHLGCSSTWDTLFLILVFIEI